MSPLSDDDLLGSKIIGVVRAAGSFALVLVPWFLATMTLYRHFFPSNMAHDLPLIALEKHLQYVFLLSAWTMVWPAVRVERWIANWRQGYLVAALGGGVLVALFILFKTTVFAALALVLLSCLMNRENTDRRWLVRWPLGLALAAAMMWVVYQRQFTLRMNLHEDGVRLATASAVLAGKVPFRDVVIHFGILQEVVKPWIAFQRWGVTYEAYLRAGAWLSAATGFGMILLVAQVVRQRWWFVIVSLILALRTDAFLADRLFFPVLAVLFSCRAIDTRRSGWGMAAGVMTVCSVLYSLDVGITLCAGLLTYAVIGWPSGSRRLVLPLAGSAAALTSLLAGIAGLTGVLSPWFEYEKALLTHFGSTWSDALPSHLYSYWHLQRRQPISYYLNLQQVPFLCLGVLAYLHRRSGQSDRSARWHQALLLSTLVFFQFFIYLGHSDFIHWMNAVPLLWPLAAMGLEEIFDASWRPAAPAGSRGVSVLMGGLIASPLLAALGGQSPLWPWIVAAHERPGAGQEAATESQRQAVPRLGKIVAWKDDLPETVELVKLIQRHVKPDEPFLELSRDGSFYFLAQRRNATSFSNIAEIQGPLMMARCMQELKKNPPQGILAFRTSTGIFCDQNARELCDYVRSRFRVGGQSGSGRAVLFVPKRDSPAT